MSKITKKHLILCASLCFLLSQILAEVVVNNTGNSEKIDSLISLISESSDGRNGDGRNVTAIKELIVYGDASVDAICARFKDSIPSGNTRQAQRSSVNRILCGINTPKARQARKNLFLPLLDNERFEMRRSGIQCLRGLELDQDLISKVLLRLQNEYLRDDVLELLTADPSTNFSKEKVRAIVQSMLSMVGKPSMELGHRSWEGKGIGSLADTIFNRHVWTLSRMKGVDVAIRDEMVVHSDGIVRDLLKISLGLRGDMKSGREPMKSFLMNSEYRTLPNNRLSCVEAFNKFGDKTDLPFLQEIASSDPYCVEEYAYYQKCEKWRDEYINRTELQIKNESTSFAPLQTVDKKQNPTKVTYPIREAAKKAIEVIEARTEAEGKSAAPKPESAERKE